MNTLALAIMLEALWAKNHAAAAALPGTQTCKLASAGRATFYNHNLCRGRFFDVLQGHKLTEDDRLNRISSRLARRALMQRRILRGLLVTDPEQAVYMDVVLELLDRCPLRDPPEDAAEDAFPENA